MILSGLAKGRPRVKRLPRMYTNLIVLEDTSDLSKSCQKGDMHLSKFCLIRGISMEKVMNILKKTKEISLSTSDFLSLIQCDETEIRCDNILEIEKTTKYGLNLYLKITNERERRSVYNRIHRSKSTQLDQLCILVKDREPIVTNSAIEIIGISFKNISERSTIFCDSCDNPFTRKDNLLVHQNNDTACSTSTIVKPVAKQYGSKRDIPRELLEAGYILPEHVNFRQESFSVFDIETTEILNDDEESREKAILSTLSISFADSEDREATFMVRDGDSLEDGKKLVQRFINLIESKAASFTERKVPTKFRESLEEIRKIEADRRKQWQQRRNEGIPFNENKLELFPVAWKNWLRSNCTYRIYGFNSSKFDNRVLAPLLFDELLNSDENKKISVLKRQTSYFNLTYELPNSSIQFLDILNYLAPCNLDQFLRMTSAPSNKGIFPHGYFLSVKQLKETREFPPFEAFFNTLKNTMGCTEKIYLEAKKLFDDRINLPANDPLKWHSMIDYLRWYNDLDVLPLVLAIKYWFNAFREQFDIDGYQYASLASMSQAAMFQQYDQKAPFLYSLPHWKKSLSDLFKKSIVGGLTTCLHRAVILDGSEGPIASKIADNGDSFTSVVPFDFNSLYPWALLQNMPCGPGVHWDPVDKNGKERPFYVKKAILPDSSMSELRFLEYLSNHDKRFQDANGNPFQIEHSYYRGQKVIEGFKVDGFCTTPTNSFVIEFNGCFHHRPCPHSGCKFHEHFDENRLQDYEWYKKETVLQKWCDDNNGILIVKWECKFRPNDHRNLRTKALPRIMRPFEPRTPKHISELVRSGELFGFVECSLKSSEKLIEKYRNLNFPPIIRREKVKFDMLSPYMQRRMNSLERKFPKEGIETVVNAWNSKDKILVFTPLLKWYLNLGIVIVEVGEIIQYQEEKCFETFVNNCVDGRIEASRAKKDTAAQTFKVAMNSRLIPKLLFF